MSDDNDLTSAVERILASVNSIVVTGAFLGMVWLAVHIVTHPDGARDVHRYFLSHFSNFVDPSIAVAVETASDGSFVYNYSVSNGPFALQSIRRIVLDSNYGAPGSPNSSWTWGLVRGFSRPYSITWTPHRDREPVTGIGRGETLTGFTIRSHALPTIVKVMAGNTMRHDIWQGYTPEITTPSGKRISRWTIGPSLTAKLDPVRTTVDRLKSDVRKAGKLGWIEDPELGIAIHGTLDLVSARLDSQEFDHAYALLDRLAEIAAGSGGAALSPEAATLIRLNVEWLRTQVRGMSSS